MEKVRLFDRRFTILVGLQCAILFVLISLYVMGGANHKSGKKSLLSWREVASKLNSAGVSKASAYAYEKALEGYESRDMEVTERSQMAYSLAEIYKEMGEWEKALTWYYQALEIDPNFKERGIINEKVIAMLEQLQKFGAVKRTLAENTSLNPTPATEKSGDVVIAEIGSEKIYLDQVKKIFNGKSEELPMFAKKYVADQLLYAKAKRLGYGEEPKFREMLVQMEKQLMVQRVLEEDVLKKVTVKEADLQNYFKANQSERYKKAKKFEEVKAQVEQDYRLEQQQQLYQKLIDDTLKTQEVKLFLDKVK